MCGYCRSGDVAAQALQFGTLIGFGGNPGSPVHDILHVRYRIDTTAPNATLPLVADFYLTVIPGIAQGEEWILRDNYNVAPNAEKVAVIDLSGSTLAANYLATVAIDSAGNSSELTLPIIFSNPLGGAIFKDGFE